MTIDHEELFIGGRLVKAHSTDRITVINPATESPVGSIVDADEVDVDRAAAAADLALRSEPWAGLTPGERGDLLRALGAALEKRTPELSELVTRQNGQPITISTASHGATLNGFYKYFAALADDLVEEENRPGAAGFTIVRREPVGVAALITAWNGPQPLLAWKVGPALAAGCTVVVKPAAETSLDAYIFAEAAQDAGFPDGVVNVITGGREAGAALVRHPAVRKVALTGSTVAGRDIARACAQDMKRVTLELGGKSAAILLDDVDLAAFAPFVGRACSPNTGQVCRALTRILAPRNRYDEIVETVADELTSIPMGDPMDPSNLFGPLVAERQRDRVEGYIEIGKKEGATLVVGGGRPAHLPVGYYVQPTVFRDVTNDMTIAREEIFGPVLSVIAYEDVDDAISIANDSDYGLGGGVFTTDADRGTDVARRIQSGSVGVNATGLAIEAPFGGVKASGIGRELGPESLDAYLEFKAIFRAG